MAAADSEHTAVMRPFVSCVESGRVYLNVSRDGETLEVELAGHWRCADLPAIDNELAAQSFDGARALRVRVPEGVQLDLAGAWRLREWLQAAEGTGLAVSYEGEPPGQIALIESTLTGAHAAPRSSSEPEFEPVMTLLRACTSWRRLRPTSIARHVYETGITAIPIVSLIAFLITLIIAYIAAQQAREYGAEIFVVDIVTVGVLRELGVLLTAIIVAGRSGSAFAAEIGAMKLNEEVDALHAIGVEPQEVLILPRVIGLVISMPLLAVIADGIGLTGGALLCKWLLDMPLPLYLDRVQDAISPTTFWVGIIKAPVFGLLIALSGTYRGLQVRDSSRELGRLTTVAVVQSIFLVIFANAIFAIVFWQLDI